MNPQRPICLVDDDPAVLQSLGFWLEAEGFTVYRFSTPDAVCDAALPDEALLVTDMRLPGMNGVELVSRLRGRVPVLPAILITSNPSRELRRLAEAQDVCIVEKPLIGAELLTVIRAID